MNTSKISNSQVLLTILLTSKQTILSTQQDKQHTTLDALASKTKASWHLTKDDSLLNSLLLNAQNKVA